MPNTQGFIFEDEDRYIIGYRADGTPMFGPRKGKTKQGKLTPAQNKAKNEVIRKMRIKKK
tara:strand:+ start:96 stop:275 length:180 start_codon:yes stop_codon:yes gene_type:complete